jgi:hypothetical protein
LFYEIYKKEKKLITQIIYYLLHLLCIQFKFSFLRPVLLDYIDHPEAKFKGNIGVLQRRHLKPKGCVYIGKEANKIVMQELESNHVEIYHDIEKIREFILNLTPDKAREIGIKYRSTLSKLKNREKEGNFKLDTKEMRKIIQNLV